MKKFNESEHRRTKETFRGKFQALISLNHGDVAFYLTHLFFGSSGTISNSGEC